MSVGDSVDGLLLPASVVAEGVLPVVYSCMYGIHAGGDCGCGEASGVSECSDEDDDVDAWRCFMVSVRCVLSEDVLLERVRAGGRHMAVMLESMLFMPVPASSGLLLLDGKGTLSMAMAMVTAAASGPPPRQVTLSLLLPLL